MNDRGPVRAYREPRALVDQGLRCPDCAGPVYVRQPAAPSWRMRCPHAVCGVMLRASRGPFAEIRVEGFGEYLRRVCGAPPAPLRLAVDRGPEAMFAAALLVLGIIACVLLRGSAFAVAVPALCWVGAALAVSQLASAWFSLRDAAEASRHAHVIAWDRAPWVTAYAHPGWFAAEIRA